MTEEEKEKYLRDNEWWVIQEDSGKKLWIHKKCNYECHIDLAVDVQILRDQSRI